MSPDTDKIIHSVLVDDERHCLETLAWQLEKFCPHVSISRRQGVAGIYL
ncbi:MAG TPA: hypothetical protein VKZ75_04155 [Cyclobacteriaceae bacterium]|nr:hypothetical protein [Cyclobacteriaceae bacterium]